MAILYHQRLRLQNFTAFSDQTLEFVSGINVLVGENGTGKTHVMKALYAWQMACHLAEAGSYAKYVDVFLATYGAKSIDEFHRTKNGSAAVYGTYGESDWTALFHPHIVSDSGVIPATQRPVFIPAIEMMAHARNMSGILRDYADFDRTCFDFVAMVTAESSSIPSPSLIEKVSVLKQLVPGEVEWNRNDQRFYLTEKGKRLPYSLVAEGIRKVTALYRLIEFNWISPGGVLFWDEPEVNLNPRWMDEIIEVLVALAQNGVQIFLATHNYVILKQIDLTLRAQRLVKPEAAVPARFFSLHKERGVSKAMWADNFADLEPNPILDQYDQMLAEDWRLSKYEAEAE